MKKKLIQTTLVAVVSFLFLNGLMAQTKDEIGEAYNNARTLSATDKAGALKGMLEVVAMCEKLGAEADDLRNMASANIPDWQYQIANDLLKEKKYDEAIAAYNETIRYSEKFNEPEKKEKSLNQLPKIYFFKGQEQMKAEDVDGALVSYDKAIGLDPDYTKAYFSKGAVYKKKGDFENMQKAMDKAYEVGMRTNDTSTAAKAKESMGSSFLSRANKAFTAKNYAQAVELAKSSLSYSPGSGSAYLILAVSYNAQSKFDMALEAAKAGLEIETKPEKQADFYFQSGKAYEGKKDVANACASYKKVTLGPNKAAADYQVATVLKCK